MDSNFGFHFGVLEIVHAQELVGAVWVIIVLKKESRQAVPVAGGFKSHAAEEIGLTGLVAVVGVNGSQFGGGDQLVCENAFYKILIELWQFGQEGGADFVLVEAQFDGGVIPAKIGTDVLQ